MAYIDGFLLPVPKKNMAAYKKLAKLGSKVWRDHGALAYHECAGDDLNLSFGVPFPGVIKAKPSETVVFSYIVYKNKAHRNKVNKAAMKDPRMASLDMKNMPFDCKRMACGGFKTIVEG